MNEWMNLVDKINYSLKSHYGKWGIQFIQYNIHQGNFCILWIVPSHQKLGIYLVTKYKNFLWECRFKGKTLFESWNLHNLYYLMLKVSEFRKEKYLFSILPKNERNICQNLTYLLGQKFFVHFLGELRKNIFAFEIYWPLATMMKPEMDLEE